MPSKTIQPTQPTTEYLTLLYVLSSIRIALTHAWGFQTINTNSKFPRGMAGCPKYGHIVCQVENIEVNCPIWARLKMYAVPKDNLHADLVEVDYVLLSKAKNQKLRVGKDGKVTFAVDIIKKYKQQTHTLPHLEHLTYFLGVELFDENNKILAQSVDYSRPYSVISSTFTQKRDALPTEKPANKRQKVTTPDEDQGPFSPPSPVPSPGSLSMQEIEQTLAEEDLSISDNDMKAWLDMYGPSSCSSPSTPSPFFSPSLPLQPPSPASPVPQSPVCFSDSQDLARFADLLLSPSSPFSPASLVPDFLMT